MFIHTITTFSITPSSRTRSKTSTSKSKNYDDKANNDEDGDNADRKAKNKEDDNDEAKNKEVIKYEATRADLNSKIGTLLKNTPDLRHAQAYIVSAVATIATKNRELKEAPKKQTATVTPNKPDQYHFTVPGPNEKEVPQRLPTVPLESLLNFSNQQQNRRDIQINGNNTVSVIDNTRTCENSTEGWNNVTNKKTHHTKQIPGHTNHNHNSTNSKG